jgi:hypothetical protein
VAIKRIAHERVEKTAAQTADSASLAQLAPQSLAL